MIRVECDLALCRFQVGGVCHDSRVNDKAKCPLFTCRERICETGDCPDQSDCPLPSIDASHRGVCQQRKNDNDAKTNA